MKRMHTHVPSLYVHESFVYVMNLRRVFVSAELMAALMRLMTACTLCNVKHLNQIQEGTNALLCFDVQLLSYFVLLSVMLV